MPNHSKRKQYDNRSSDKNDTNTYTKNCIITKEVLGGEVPDKFKEEFSKVDSHCHVKRIQEREFQNDLKDDTLRVLQIDFAMSYQCKLQREHIGSL